MTIAKRLGRRWSVNEIIQLQREYELLKWSLDEIAEKHERSVNAIMFKLHAEGIVHYNFLYGKYYNAYPVVELNPSLPEDEDDEEDDEEDERDDEEEDYEDDDEEDEHEDDEEDDDCEDNEYNSIEDLADRVWSLEKNFKNIGNMLSMMFKSWKTPKKSVNFSSSLSW